MLTLHGFFNSSAAYRVRIALALKGLQFETVSINLRAGIQNEHEYRGVNPAGLVPTLDFGKGAISQSLAIIDYLDELHPEPRLVPNHSPDRTRVLEIAQLIACDMHPLNNLRVLNFLTGPLGLNQAQRTGWIHHWLSEGFRGLEPLLPTHGDWCVGHAPTLADCCLVPQVSNAERAGFDLEPYPRIRRIAAQCRNIPAFIAAQPSAQSDFVTP